MVINALLLPLPGYLYEDKKKKSLSGLLIIFRPVISNTLLSYVKLFSCALGNKWDLADRHSHAKGGAEMCCGAVQT